MATRLGIVGGGQLGRMLALAAVPLGIDCSFIDPSREAGARVAAEQIVAGFEDVDALIELSERSDIVTFEFENVSAAALEAIANRVKLAPSPRSLETSQDRLLEKQLFESLGLPVAPYYAVESLEQLRDAIRQIGTPAILKTRRLGYDGKGQVRIGSPDDAGDAWQAVASVPSLLESHVDFTRELSVVVIRTDAGHGIAYPLTENVHRAGILHTSRAPVVAGDDPLQALAVEHAMSIAERLGHVGALALELFDVAGELVLNELAPRVHNSGHWTIDGCGSSQFENHVRAVAGLPLGAVAPIIPTVMVNLVGGLPKDQAILAIPGAHLHHYGKVPRTGRKVGHVNVVELGATAEPLERRAARAITLADEAGG